MNSVGLKIMEEGYIWIALGIAFVVVLCFVFFFFRHKKSGLRKEKNDWLVTFEQCLGGKENILSMEAKGSRLSIVLYDYQLVDEQKLKTIGIDNILKMTKKWTLVIGRDSQKIVDTLLSKKE